MGRNGTDVHRESISVYYYGKAHLSVKLYGLLDEALAGNRRIVLFPEESFCWLDRSGILRSLVDRIGLVQERVSSYCIGREAEAISELLSRLKEGRRGDFQKVTSFFEVSELIREKSKAGYFQWQKELAEIPLPFVSRQIYLFDLEDYLGPRKFIDDEVLHYGLTMPNHFELTKGAACPFIRQC